jgi:CxxC-x17-CxxC domain-containing protein
MGNFNKGGGGRYDNRGGGRGFGGRNRGRPDMHKAICIECGAQCEVPFRPTGDKPVYCNECFKSAGGGKSSGGRDFGRKDFGGRRDDRGERRMYQATCAECGNRCEVPFRPTGDKPVLCNECFGGGTPAPKKQPEQSNQKQDEILAKLDKIIALLQRTNPVKEVTVMKSESSHSEARATTKHEPQGTKIKPKKSTPKKAVSKPKAKAKKKAK